ncbi:MAG: hypothetical protein LUF89_02150 [Ruminococcus sp.]|nr:hypothetical protein [Ruminococcus sp.]
MHYNSLYHHGILGQKWGKKNSPPYLLDSADHSASEKKAGWRKSLDKSNAKVYNKSSKSSENDEKTKKKSSLSDKQKKALKIGAIAAGVALAAFGTYQLAKSGKLDGLIGQGKSVASSLLDDNETKDVVGNISNGLKKLSQPESISEAISHANPNRGNLNYNNNCTLCSIATFLRTQGYDVIAGSTSGEGQILGGIVEECFKNAKVLDGTATKFGRSRQDAAEMLVKHFGENASGVCSVAWKDEGYGHAFNWSIKDGIVSFFDGQKAYNNDLISARYWDLIDKNKLLTLARLDNAEPNVDAIKKWLE